MLTSPSRQILVDQRLSRFKQVGKQKPLTDEQIREYIRPRNRRILLSGAVLFVIVGLITRIPLFILCGLLFASIDILPEIWSLVSLRRVTIERSFAVSTIPFGELTTVHYRVENRKRFPLPWLEVEDEYPLALSLPAVPLLPHYKYDRGIFLTGFSLWMFQRITRRYTVQGVERGVWTCGPIYLRASDPFGFLDNEIKINQVGASATLTVLPIIVPLTEFGLPPRHPFGDLRALRRIIVDPQVTIGARDYAPGDPLRQVHWKASARVNKLQSKVYMPTISYTLVTFLDVRTTPTIVDGIEPEYLELGVAAAASVVTWATAQRYTLGLFTNSIAAAGAMDATSFAEIQASMRVPPSNNPQQLHVILKTLAQTQPILGGSMERLVAKETGRLPVGSTIVYIATASVVSENILYMLQRLQRSGHSVTLLLIGNGEVQTGTLTKYRLGGKEKWYDIVEYNRSDRERRLGRETAGPGSGSRTDANQPERKPVFTLA